MELSIESRKMLMKTIECPVCLCLPDSTPISQCGNGHIICKTCRTSLTTCPQCRKPLADIRNLSAELILEAFTKRCPLELHGCAAKFLPDREEEHLKGCMYRRVLCPWSCKQMISIKSVRSHLQSFHDKGQVSFHATNDFRGQLKSDDISPEIRRPLVCLSYEKQDFILMTSRPQPGHLHFWIYGVGGQDQMSKLLYNLELWNGETRMTWVEQVVSIQKPPSAILSGGDGVMLTDFVLKKLTKNGSINYMISIQKK